MAKKKGGGPLIGIGTALTIGGALTCAGGGAASAAEADGAGAMLLGLLLFIVGIAVFVAGRIKQG